MNLIHLLKTDLKEIRFLCRKLKSTPAHAQKRMKNIFDVFSALLFAHTRAKHEVVYNKLHLTDGDTRGADYLMQEFSSLSADSAGESAGWVRKIRTLATALDRYIEEEEKNLFPAIRRFMTEAQLDQLAGVFLERKMALLEQGEAAA